jgi:exodeoxyribonuclease V gamma subunit
MDAGGGNALHRDRGISLLTVIRSNRLERLADELARRLQIEPRGSPLEPEVVSVQSQGMRAWLGQQLALRLGVFAGVRTPFPRDLLDGIFEETLGARPGEAPLFQPEVMAFAIADALPDLLGDPSFEPLRGYLGDDDRGVKLHQLSRVLAKTFDEYLVFRPELILGWQERPPSDSWQATLWNALRRRAGGEGRHVAEAARELLEKIGRGDLRGGAPERRLSLFGVTTLPPLHVRLLAALPEGFDVRWYLLAPTPEYFADIDREALAAAPGAGGHPLLASLGRVGRELQQVLIEAGGDAVREIDLFAEPDRDGALGALQRDIFETRPEPPPPADGTIEIHACHGPAREAEVLKDRLLSFLDDPVLGLAPHEVLVLTPDIDLYAPYIEAVFSRDRRAGRAIPLAVTDCAPRGEAPAAEAFAALLGLVRGRARLSEVIDLLAREPVRARFDLTAADVEELHRMLAEAGVRWGIDGRHRAALGQPPAEENTWRFGLDRLLLGRALSAEGRTLFGGVAPRDSDGLDASSLLTRLVRFTETLFDALARLDGRHRSAEWRRLLADAHARLFDPPAQADGEPDAVPRIIADLARAAERAGFGGPLDFDVVRDLLLAAIDGQPGERRFLSRGVQISDLKPMRSIPARVVALVGMNDGAFPRTRIAPGFDLIAIEPRPGDRSIREDDRYLFLESLLSARDRLVVTYAGRDACTGAELSPSVVISELLETVDRAALLEHPLHPFDPRYFEPRSDAGAAGPPRLFTYAAGQLEAARAAAGERREPPRFVAGPLPRSATPDLRVVRLADLVRFWRFPAAWFLERRLGVRPPPPAARAEDREPDALGPLERWSLGTAMLEWLLTGSPADRLPAWLRALGSLPHGAIGAIEIERLRQQVEPVLREGRRALAGRPLAPLDVRLGLHPGGAPLRLEAWLGDLREDGRARCRFSRLGPFALLEHWIGHLALCAAAPPGHPRRSVLVARPEDDPGAGRVELAPLERAAARARLEDLAGLLLAGEAEPLPFHPDPSLAYLVALRKGDDPVPALFAARKSWKELAERADPATIRLFAEGGLIDGAPTGDGSSFDGLARRVFGPLLDHLDAGGDR